MGPVAVLALELGPVDRAPVHARRCARLEARHCKSNTLNMLCDGNGGLITRSASGNLGVGADVDAAAQEGASREHHGTRAPGAAVRGLDARHARALEQEPAHHALGQLEGREAFEQLSHGSAVQCAVALRARRPHGRALGAVEHPELDRRAVGGASHDAAQRVDLAHHRALRDPADRGIAAHLPDRVEVRSEEHRLRAEPGGHDGGLAPGMARADDDHVNQIRHDRSICTEARGRQTG